LQIGIQCTHPTTFFLSSYTLIQISVVRATAPSTVHNFANLKLNEEKSKHASLAEQHGFGPAFLHSLMRLAKGRAKAS
jgi:hypothetical protein